MHAHALRARLALGALLLAAGSLPAQDVAAHVQTILGGPATPQASDAALALASNPDRAAALAAIQEAWEGRPPSGVAAARLAGAAVALGAEHLDEAVSQLLAQGTDAEKLAALAPLARAQVVRPKVAAAVAKLATDPSPEVVRAAALAQSHLEGLGSSSSLWFFLGLLVLAAGGAFWYLSGTVDEAGVTSDMLVGWVDEWGAKPGERPAILERIRAQVEEPVPRFLELFAGPTRLTTLQVIAMLDLLSHFDVDPVHEKLYEFSTHQDDELRKAAILAMHRLGDQAWVGVLADFVQGEDDVARYAGATALARRGAVDQLPLLRQEVERTRLGSVRDGIMAAIEKLEALS